MAIMPSEYIQIIAAEIYAIALFYTVVTFDGQRDQIKSQKQDLNTMILGICGSGILAYLIL